MGVGLEVFPMMIGGAVLLLLEVLQLGLGIGAAALAGNSNCNSGFLPWWALVSALYPLLCSCALVCAYSVAKRAFPPRMERETKTDSCASAAPLLPRVQCAGW